MSRRSFLKMALAAAVSSAASQGSAQAARSVTASGGELAALGYTDDPFTGIDGIRLRWSFPTFRPVAGTGDAEFIGFPDSVRVLRASLDMGDLRQSSNWELDDDNQVQGAPTVGLRSTHYPERFWRRDALSVSLNGFDGVSPTVLIERPLEVVAHAVRVWFDGGVWATMSGGRPITDLVRRVRVVDRAGNCLLNCDAGRAAVERLDIYCESSEVDHVELLLDAATISGAGTEAVRGALQDHLLGHAVLDLDGAVDDIGDLATQGWQPVANVGVGTMFADCLDQRTASERLREFRARIKRQSRRLERRSGSAPWGTIDDIAPDEWADFLELVMRAQASHDLSETCPIQQAPTQTVADGQAEPEGDFLGLNPWDAIALLLADRWSFATMAGFGYHDVADGSRGYGDAHDRVPHHDFAYRAIATYSRPDGSAFEMATNLAIANNVDWRRVPDLVAPASAEYILADLGFTKAIALHPTRPNTLVHRDGVDAVHGGQPAVLIGEAVIQARPRAQPFASGLLIANRTPERVQLSTPHGQSVSQSGDPVDSQGTSEWELVRLLAVGDCAAGDRLNVRSGDRPGVPWLEFDVGLQNLVATTQLRAEVRAEIYATDAWDRVSSGFVAIEAPARLAYAPPAPYIADHVVLSAADPVPTVQLTFEELASMKFASDSAAGDQAADETAAWLAPSWPPAAPLAVEGARAELHILRRQAEPRTLAVRVLSRAEVRVVPGGVYVDYVVRYPVECDGSLSAESNVEVEAFIGGNFVAATDTGRIESAQAIKDGCHFLVRAFESHDTTPDDSTIDALLAGRTTKGIPPRFGARPCGDDDRVVPLRRETYGDAGRPGFMSEPPDAADQWTRVVTRDISVDRPLCPSVNFFERDEFDRPIPAPYGNAERRTYAARIIYFEPGSTDPHEGPLGNEANVVVLPAPPAEPPPFTLKLRGFDYFGRLFIEVVFEQPGVRGTFEVAWSLSTEPWKEASDGIDADGQEPTWFSEEALPGAFGAQELIYGSSIFDLLDLQGSAGLDDVVPRLTVGVRRVDAAHQASRFTVVTRTGLVLRESHQSLLDSTDA